MCLDAMTSVIDEVFAWKFDRNHRHYAANSFLERKSIVLHWYLSCNIVMSRCLSNNTHSKKM